MEDSAEPRFQEMEMPSVAPGLLYRIRKLDHLLKYGELEKQEIYFATTSQLNDPMEGFRDVFWEGDRIAWENLFRHYLRCLSTALSIYHAEGELIRLHWGLIPIVGPKPWHAGHDQAPDLVREINRDFLQEAPVERLIRALSKRPYPVRRDELRTYLTSLHYFALGTIVRRVAGNRSGPLSRHAEELLQQGRKALPVLEAMVDANGAFKSAEERIVGALSAAFGVVHSQIWLGAMVNSGAGEHHHNRDFLYRSFPQEFADQLDRLLYPDWYVACFMEDCSNASLWGTYGEGHTGVCLIFKPEQEAGRASLPVVQNNGWGSTGPSKGQVMQPFHKVQYTSTFSSIDFFRSIGSLPAPSLRQHWHSDEDGELSSCATESDDDWRHEYWRGFYPGVTTKLSDWKHEKEHRLLLMGVALDFSDQDDRIVTYDFKNLQGLIFGIKTPLEAKIQICRIIGQKCRSANRPDFKYYEAFYSPETERIEHRELSLLR